MLSKRTLKPWGHEEILAQEPSYVLKRLVMHAGKRCSLQYHRFKTETVFLVSGELKVELDSNRDTRQTIKMNEGEHLTIRPNQIHRMEAITESVYLETSSTELDDVVRLEDDYGRI